MGFTRRLLKAKDFLWCASILEDGFENRPDLRSRLPQLWSDLIVIDALTMVIIVDDARRRPVAFAAAAVVTDECIEVVLASAQPNLAVRVLEREFCYCNSSRPFIMRLEDIRKVNHPKRGTNLAVLHYSEVMADYKDEEIRAVRDKALHALLEMQCGYQLKEFVMEFYGEKDLPFTRAMGLQLRNDYQDYLRKTPVDADRHPYLVGLRKDEVLKAEKWGSPIAMLFSYSPPVCRFSIAQQRILVRACRGLRDTDIALELGVEESTLREHWRAIFIRVEAAQRRGAIPPELLPDFSEPKNRSRGWLIPYLTQHPEELRPSDPRYFADS